MRRGFASVGLIGLTLTAVPAAQAGPLHGTISISVLGGRVHGYGASLAAVVGTGGDDGLTFGLGKMTGRVTQSHAWSVPLPSSDVTINRAKASIRVVDHLGPGGTDGELNFTFSGLPRRQNLLPCSGKHNVVKGALNGTIRIRIGDSFFKTVTVKHMTGVASDTPSPPAHCPLPPCPPSSYSLDGTGASSPTVPSLRLDASSIAVRGDQLRLLVGVSELTAGTPFSEILHKMSVAGTKSLLATNPNLTSATVSTPGGALSGGLSLVASGPLTTSRYACKGGYVEAISRPVQVTTGLLTAAFDSIGTLSEDTNLNSGFLLLQMLKSVPNEPPTMSHPHSTLHLREFLSPDRKVWCVVEDRGCGTYPQPPTRAAQIDRQGNVTLCDVPTLTYPPGGHVPLGCFQNWNNSAPILRYGQSDLYNGVLCTSATNGITCTVASGAGKGKGFRINKREAVKVG